MMGLLIAVHIIICVLLIIVILIQQGRGGGLVEGLSNVESMFGPKTNTFLSRTTGILSTLFLITCLSLAFLSARQSRSLMSNIKIKEESPKTVSKGQEASPKAQSSDLVMPEKTTPAEEAPAQKDSGQETHPLSGPEKTQ